jgi:hypothetical protein
MISMETVVGCPPSRASVSNWELGPWTSREELVSFAQVGREGLTGERDLAPKGEQRSDQAPH